MIKSEIPCEPPDPKPNEALKAAVQSANKTDPATSANPAIEAAIRRPPDAAALADADAEAEEARTVVLEGVAMITEREVEVTGATVIMDKDALEEDVLEEAEEEDTTLEDDSVDAATLEEDISVEVDDSVGRGARDTDDDVDVG